ncbi:MAG: hypothetical protein H5U07_03340 [Candidatus Aminicenantes bacterium]|nr:hypothetical protein [Candidatus Aminicenantes bacterium]
MSLTSLINTTLPGFLFDLREKNRTGVLTINPGSYEKKFCFLNGDLVVSKKYFPEKEFVDYLIEIGQLEPPLRLNQELIGSEIAGSVVGLIIEHGFLSAEETFTLIKNFYILQLTELISVPKLNFNFTEENFSAEEILLAPLSTTAIILNGIRKIKNIELFRVYLPASKAIISRKKSSDLSWLNLSAAEHYLLNLLSRPMSLEQLMQTSWLGPSETQKTLFLFSCLHLIELNQPQVEAGLNNNLFTPDMEYSFAFFNEKYTLIYRYLAKQLGPVAINLMEKCYHEVQELLDPIFQNLEIKPDGSFELRPMLRLNLNDLSPKEKKVLLRGFDEIILAALLMVRKNLGSRHEEAVIRLLKKNQKNGELS